MEEGTIKAMMGDSQQGLAGIILSFEERLDKIEDATKGNDAVSEEVEKIRALLWDGDRDVPALMDTVKELDGLAAIMKSYIKNIKRAGSVILPYLFLENGFEWIPVLMEKFQQLPVTP